MSRLIPSLLITVMLLFSMASCEEVDVPKGTPNCIKEKIKQIEKESVRNPPAKVWQYEYQGQTVYYIPPYCCDMYGELYDEQCGLICHPDGGFTGNGDGGCSDFFTARTNEKLIWQDPR
jgi:hypothetical protein